MIEVKATITIIAETDDEIDEVYRAIHPLDDGWPGRVVRITELSRELVRE
jgi:hypothetical protein